MNRNITAETDPSCLILENKHGKKSDKKLYTTHSAEMGFGLRARNFTIVPESFPTRYAGSLGGRLALVSTFTLDCSIRFRIARSSLFNLQCR